MRITYGGRRHEKILGDLDRCKAKLNEIRTLISKDWGESNSKAVYMVACALILHYLAIQHISASGLNLISLRCSKGMQYIIQDPESSVTNILRVCQRGDCKLRPTVDELQFLFGLKDEETPKELLRRKVKRRLLRRLPSIRASHPRSWMTFFMLITPPHKA